MSKSAPSKQPAKIAQESAERGKADRLAAALRDNLKRRKAQQRARDETSPDDPPSGE
jgi:hypothetical protein